MSQSMIKSTKSCVTHIDSDHPAEPCNLIKVCFVLYG